MNLSHLNTFTHKFEFDSPLSLDTLYSEHKLSDSTRCIITINKNPGSFYAEFENREFSIYEEIGLETDECNETIITGYDGVFELPPQLIEKLEELGFNCDEVK